MTIRALLLGALLMAASVAPLSADTSFVSGVWKGEANYDSDGNFRDCTMTAESESGVLLGFVISKNFDWGLVLADEEREFEVGSTHAVIILVDSRDPIPALAKVVDPHGILIPLENSNPMVEAMREGKVLTIQTDGMTVSFKLTGTRDAIAELAACVTENKSTEKVELDPPDPLRLVNHL
jgi:hypothetical protein